MSAALDLSRDAAPAASAAPVRTLLRFITCGSVDDGKSTLIGRLLYDSALVQDDLLEALDRDSRKFGTQGDKLDMALLVDGLAAEREQGITIDVAYRYFATPRRSFIVADTPGHEQYTRNMATGASGAELAVILVDARKGVLPQTRRHSFIVSLLGVRHVLVAVNKMDLVGYDKAVFERIAAAYRELAAGLGFTSVEIVPISARDGDNVARPSPRLSWHQGPTLVGYLETIDAGDDETLAAGFRMPVQWVNRPNLDFRGYCGTVAKGHIEPGDPVRVLPGGRASTIARVLTADGDLPCAVAGQAVTLVLADEVDVSRGDVLAADDGGTPVRSAFAARLLWMTETPLASGDNLLLRQGTATAQATVRVTSRVDVETYREERAEGLPMNGLGAVTVRLDRPLAVAPYVQDRELGAFILIDRITNDTVALGVIEQVDVVADAAPEVGAKADSPLRPLLDWARRQAAPAAESADDAFREWLSRRLVGAGALGVAAGAATGLAWVGIATASADLVLRTGGTALHREVWRRVFARRDERLRSFRDGGGI
ncbi:sulfate adenylyltransferase subunit CysN [Alsobacter sp. SYSU M60028]|uniref:Sulfate adenylyltransferase subunit 1 n=1 Tax=Alsobacter ponti TaxID=2962936 RepID=A0ABT1LFX7_9HYPH|nr:sulfate adenylyltransferase subunit CysN [Alsobacter ponti]MCP8940018.1 sulfate adenylyltransferase subunit CysN [Alsobacter ponti]